MTRENARRMVPVAAGGRRTAGLGARLRAVGATRRGPGRRRQCRGSHPALAGTHAVTLPAWSPVRSAPPPVGRRERAPARRPLARTGTGRLPQPPFPGFPWSRPLRRGTAPARARMARLPRPAWCAVTSPSTPALTPAVPETGPGQTRARPMARQARGSGAQGWLRFCVVNWAGTPRPGPGRQWSRLAGNMSIARSTTLFAGRSRNRPAQAGADCDVKSPESWHNGHVCGTPHATETAKTNKRLSAARRGDSTRTPQAGKAAGPTADRRGATARRPAAVRRGTPFLGPVVFPGRPSCPRLPGGQIPGATSRERAGKSLALTCSAGRRPGPGIRG